MLYTKEQSRLEIANLVDHFRLNERTLLDAPEAQIEANYIRRLFSFLNWNTENAGLSVSEWEFVLQRTDEKGKRPDYILQLDGQQVLVMDAKKVKYDLHDPRWLTQVYAYAYSTQNQPGPRKIDFAILTDFQEFILLDCTLYAATPQAVNNFRILDWRYPDYVDKFDELWELFERENVRASIRACDAPNPPGLWGRYLSPKKVKANRIPPDKSFLAVMDDEQTGWRVRLAKDMKKHNPQADGALITAAVQLLIDRLIFVKVLSDREIEADYLTQLAETVEKSGLSAGDAGWFNACRDIFTRLNQFYNGSIFEPRPELESVTVSNKVVRGVIHELQPENSPYNFAVLPVEILGTIYERFLGRVVRTTEQRVKIEDKPEVRKAGGVYYTPQYIVDYIVENTVGKLLSECKTPVDVAKLKILDPACGSGSFLLGAYAALIRWHAAYYSDKEQLTRHDREAAYYDSDGRVRLTARLKRQILLNNIYGVDIDAQAVEVTRFSLSLKALEDTRRDELYEERTLFRQTVLPDLRPNIKCGNSLIGPDYFTGQMFNDPIEIKRVNAFDWKAEFSQIMAANGFDAVIGNPPYVRQEGLGKDKEYYKTHYKTFLPTSDLYVNFLEKEICLLKKTGLLGMIVSNKWLRAAYGRPLRKYLTEAASISQVVDLAGLPVFENATVRTIIIICTPEVGKHSTYQYIAPPSQKEFVMIRGGDGLNNFVAQKAVNLSASNLSQDGWSFASADTQKIFEHINNVSVSLTSYIRNKPYFGVKTGFNKAFIIDRSTRDNLIAIDPKNAEIIKPLVGGRDVRQYSISYDDKYLIWTYIGVTIDKYPAIFEFLKQYQPELQKRWDKGNFWWELRACDYYAKFFEPKIIYPDIATSCRFYLDKEGFLGSNTTYFLPSNDVYLLGILNSELAQFYFTKVCAGLEGGGVVYLRFFGQYMENFPVRVINFSDPADKARHDRMVLLVESMLELHKHKIAAKTQAVQEQLQRQIVATDRQIDELVYELYDLTEEEIKVVEAK